MSDFDPSRGDYEIDAIRQAWALLARLDGRGRLRAAAYLVTLAVESPIRDSDGSPKGGDAEGGSVHDGADPKGIAQHEYPKSERGKDGEKR